MSISSGHTLLIVDDCPEDREVYREYLSYDPQYSYTFVEASRAEVGLEIFPSQKCDVVLLDFYLPDMDGLEFLAELRNQQQTNCPPVIMLTGVSNEDLAIKAMKHGIQDYLVKQYLQPEALQLAVRKVIQQSQLQTELRKTRERQRIIATTALRIRQSLDLDQMLHTVVSEIQQLLECDHVGVYQQNEDQDMLIRAELGTRYTPPRIQHTNSFSSFACSRVSEIISDTGISTNEDIIAPILISTPPAQSRRPWGCLIVHQETKRTPWSPEEHIIVNELTEQLAIAIQQAELLKQTQEALEKAQDLNHFKTKIIATVSHEYRTPLATILASASTLEKHHDRLIPSKRKQFLSMIQAQARHMAKLVEDMLTVHQCELLGQTKFEPSPINLLPFIANLVEEHRQTAQESHALHFSVSGHIHSFWGDAGLLRLILDNLLSNAKKYSPESSTINVSLRGQEKSIVLSVQDEGIGIPKLEQQNLFESFHRASNVGTIGGTGLGLTIVKACVDAHRGSISLESQENKGTSISITLPNQVNSSQISNHSEQNLLIG